MRNFLIAFVLLFWSCAEDVVVDPIEVVLRSESPQIYNVMQNLEAHEIQIKLSTISKIKDSIVFKDYDFQVDANNYYYPASTVKFPASILSLEKLNEDGLYTLDTSFFVEGDSTMTTFRHEIRDIFAVSSNDTYNRLFEFLGTDFINSKLKEKGLVPSQISHRLEVSDANDITTKPLIFIDSDSTLITTESIINKSVPLLSMERLIKGVGYYRNNELINEPMDFSEKNYLPIATLHNMMKRLIFPESFPNEQRFNLTENYRSFLIESMAILPKNAGYTSKEYFDGYGKFFIYGDTKEDIPDHIKIHNKVGYAYGYLTDCAYIMDTKHNLEYILTATIHVNSDGVFNDDVYEYDAVGLPFLAQFGREIHQFMIDQ